MGLQVAFAEDKTLKQVAVEQFGFLTSEEFDQLVVPSQMTAPKKRTPMDKPREL